MLFMLTLFLVFWLYWEDIYYNYNMAQIRVGQYIVNADMHSSLRK